MSQGMRLLLGDCKVRMRSLAPDSLAAIVCDPPYLIDFMGKKWDSVNLEPEVEEDEAISTDQQHEMQVWHRLWLAEAYRVLQPGGIIKAFSATRTYHRLAMAMQEVGFVDLHLEAWVQGQGFPKSLNLSKAIDRHLGKASEREVVATYNARGYSEVSPSEDGRNQWAAGEVVDKVGLVTAAASAEAKRFDGYGTALKPAFEPFVCGRKPLP